MTGKLTRSFPDNRSLYTTQVIDADILQSDGWKGFIAIDFHSGAKKTVSGIVLSNSCDVDVNNPRPVTPNVTFAPLISLSSYGSILKTAGHSEQQLGSVFEAIRKQQVTSLMYLPEVRSVMPESIALFGDVRAQPVDHFRAGQRSLIFRLNDFGFYLFLFKLSIHFTRMLEEVKR